MGVLVRQVAIRYQFLNLPNFFGMVAPAVSRGRAVPVSPIYLAGDNDLDPGIGQFFPERVGIVALVGEKGVDPICDHAH